MTAIFISHRSSDNAESDALRSWLAQQGHEQLFLDFDPADGIPAGVDWEQRLYQELRRCQALLIVLTPAWLASKWCGNELAIAREKGKAVFIVRVTACTNGPLIPAIQEVDLTVDREAGLAKLARGLKEHGLDPASAFDWKPGRPIYPGLAAFDIDDAATFFGRSQESWQAVEALRRLRLQATGSPKLLLITGASGSGKSSLMRAGVLARLRKETASWIVARPFRRGGDAMGALAEALVWAFPSERRPTSLTAIADRLTGQDGAAQLLGMARELRLALDRPDGTLVLALDQAEELLAAEQADDATRLLDLFRGTLARVGNEILVLASMRSDRLGGWQQHASIRATAEHSELPFEMLPLGPMPMARISEIVRGPAAYEGLRIDDDLVDAIRTDTPTADALPLLAYTLQYLHRHFADDGRLTLVEYRSFGGLEGSVRSQADAAIPIERLSEDDRRALQEAFVPGLVRATADGGFSRNRASLASLPARAEPYLRRLVDDARLLATDRDPHGDVTVEVAHEALLRVWPTLARWIDADALNLRRLEALQRAAADWAQNGRGEDFLIHRDHRLSDVEALIAEPRFSGRLDAVDRDYLNTCRAQQNLHEAEERAAQERELLAAKKLAAEQKAKARLRLAGLVVTSVSAVLLAFLGWWAFDRAKEAERQTELAEERALTARIQALAAQARRFATQATSPNQIELAGALALESIHRAGQGGRPIEADAIEAERAAWTSLPLELLEQGTPVTSLAVMVDGRLASGGHDGRIRLWPADGKGEPVVLEQGTAVTSLAVLVDGRLASGDHDGRIRLWPADGKGTPEVLKQVSNGIIALAALPDGRLASGSGNGRIRVWPANFTDEPTLLGQDGAAIQSLVVLPDGRLASSRPIDGVQLWPANFTDEPTVLGQDGAAGKLLAALPDGRLAIGYFDGRIRLLPTDGEGEPMVLGQAVKGASVNNLVVLADGRLASSSDYYSDHASRVLLWPTDGEGEPAILEQGAPVTSLAVLADGRLASGDYSGRIRLWPTDGRGEPAVIEQGVAVSSLAEMPDGRLASGYNDDSGRSIQLWPTNGNGKPAVFEQSAWVTALAALPDGRLAGGLGNGSVLLWPADGKGTPEVLEQGSPVFDAVMEVRDLALLPDGRLASGRGSGRVVLLSTDGKGRPTVLQEFGAGTSLAALAALPDGRRLASGGRDGRVLLWPTDGEGEPAILEQGAPVTSLAVLADGRLASGGEDGRIRLWLLDGKSEPAAVLGQGVPVTSLAALADGRLASGGGDGRIRLWPADGKGEPVVFEQTAPATSLAVLANGRLASAGGDGIRVWLVDTDRASAALCLRAGRNLSLEEWGRYLGPDEPWQPSCRDLQSTWRTPDDVAAAKSP